MQMQNKKQFTIRTALIVVTLAACVFAVSSRTQLSYPNGTSYISNGTGESTRVYWTRVTSQRNNEDLGVLVQAFVPHPSLAVTVANVPEGEDPKVTSQGVFLVVNRPNELWLDGKKVDLPEDFKLFAILPDGTIRKLDMEESDCNKLCSPRGEVIDVKLWEEVVNPTLGSAGG